MQKNTKMQKNATKCKNAKNVNSRGKKIQKKQGYKSF